MGTIPIFECICRLCGIESYDLIPIFHPEHSERNLSQLISKYLNINISEKDALPQQLCGPCIAKLDEAVDFISACINTQITLKMQWKEHQAALTSTSVEDRMFALISDVKVELQETQDDFIEQDDLTDLDYGARPSKRKGSKARSGRGQKKKKKLNQHVPAKKRATKKLLQSSSSPSVGVAQDEAEKEDAVNGKKEAIKEEDEIDVEGEGSEGEVESEADFSKGMWMQGLPQEQIQPRKATTKGLVFRCHVCDASFPKPDSLATHCRVTHQDVPRYQCDFCPKAFLRKSSFYHHRRRKHQEKNVKCPKCSKAFPAHYLWKRHMLVHTDRRPFTCQECGKMFKSKAELHSHRKVHQPGDERYSHCCEVCGKRFTQKANLDSHLRLHTGDRPFACEFCGRCFSQKGNMEEHRRIHTGEKPFVCEICGVSYSRQGQLAVHRKSHTGEKPHKCRFCEKEFLRKEVLKKHENVHTDTRPFACQFCEKKFRDQGKRKVHERLHTGERPYQCKYCGRGFCESGNLRKHIRVHEKWSFGENESTNPMNSDTSMTSQGTVENMHYSFAGAVNQNKVGNNSAKENVDKQNNGNSCGGSVLVVPEVSGHSEAVSSSTRNTPASTTNVSTSSPSTSQCNTSLVHSLTSSTLPSHIISISQNSPSTSHHITSQHSLHMNPILSNPMAGSLVGSSDGVSGMRLGKEGAHIMEHRSQMEKELAFRHPSEHPLSFPTSAWHLYHS
ncbi:uncharacterized protein LOC143021236 isoform X2 [Oratosquilla oratoria]|uniref:uncharacterized protein LOC143021236 isoform X2 n=1 Tax=Oratosquilla oratoria TaxID=337810 RepID=UPI003F76D85F